MKRFLQIYFVLFTICTLDLTVIWTNDNMIVVAAAGLLGFAAELVVLALAARHDRGHT